MNIKTVVKIDLCKSKIFNAEKEINDPNIRKKLLNKLLNEGERFFPAADKKFPDGSFYKAEGDAILYFLEKPTVAIRSSIEFMKQWYYLGSKNDLPECRIIIHRGEVDTISGPNEEIEVVSTALEELSVLEKNLPDGKIIVSDIVKNNSDMTLTKFIFLANVSIVKNKKIGINYVAYDDPRTFKDDTLVHMLFVAHKETKKVRKDILRCIILEYLNEKCMYYEGDYKKFKKWSKEKSYPVIPKNEFDGFLKEEHFVKMNDEDGKQFIALEESIVNEFDDSKKQYEDAVKEAVNLVSDEIKEEFKNSNAIEVVDLRTLMDEYLCAIFSEIRMMANYFRNTLQFFDSDRNIFKRYDYVIERYLLDCDKDIIEKWKIAFLNGLRKLSRKDNLYISFLFYNVLAGYYLNRTTQTSPYQLEKLQNREIYIDTNILYSLMCENSNYWDQINYLNENLKRIGLKLRIFSFSLDEYESSIKKVENDYKHNLHGSFLIERNPWLYQEYMLNPGRYFNDIGICRVQHSVTKDVPFIEENCNHFAKTLSELNILLDVNFFNLEAPERDELWHHLRYLMLSRTGVMEDYYNHADRLDNRPDYIIDHDVKLIKKVNETYQEKGEDELGPIVLLITTDTKLTKCKTDYPFVITTEQFLEFMLPYLFLGDIPRDNPNIIPNQLLLAQLGVHSSHWRPPQEHIVSQFLANPDSITPATATVNQFTAAARTLSSGRFQEIISRSNSFTNEEKMELSKEIAIAIDESISNREESYFAQKKIERLEKELKKIKTEKEKIEREKEKLEKTSEKYRKKTKYLKRYERIKNL